MAIDLPRTTADDVVDALARLDAAERELANWRAHLHRGIDGNPGVLAQARRCAAIVTDCMADARTLTGAAAQRAAVEDDAASARAFATTSLRSVS